MSRRKIQLKPTGKPRPDSAEDYVIYVTTRFATEGYFFGELSVVRRTDGRKLFPFVGAPPIGPFGTVGQAREAAAAHGASVIAADLWNPES